MSVFVHVVWDHERIRHDPGVFPLKRMNHHYIIGIYARSAKFRFSSVSHIELHQSLNECILQLVTLCNHASCPHVAFVLHVLFGDLASWEQDNC